MGADEPGPSGDENIHVRRWNKLAEEILRQTDRAGLLAPKDSTRSPTQASRGLFLPRTGNTDSISRWDSTLSQDNPRPRLASTARRRHSPPMLTVIHLLAMVRALAYSAIATIQRSLAKEPAGNNESLHGTRGLAHPPKIGGPLQSDGISERHRAARPALVLAFRSYQCGSILPPFVWRPGIAATSLPCGIKPWVAWRCEASPAAT